MTPVLRSLGCILWALPLGLGCSYLFVPSASDALRYGMFAYCTAITFGPHLLYLFLNQESPFRGLAAFLVGQFFHFTALFLCAAFFFLLYPALLEPALVLFLLFVGSFLFFQLASAGGGRFCGAKE